MNEIMDTQEDLELMAAEPPCECRRVDVDRDDPRDCELHNGEYESRMEAQTIDCSGCGAELADDADQFTCTGCDEVFCFKHLIRYDGEDACPACALFWAQSAKDKLARSLAENVELRMNRRAA